MLLSITCKDKIASEISYLFCKNPTKLQEFKISFGNVYIFYSKYTDEEVIFNMLLDLDPIDLVKGKEGANKDNYYDLFDYINDKGYSSNSIMASAITKVLDSAINGKCKEKPELIEKEWDLTCNIVNLPINSNRDSIVEDIFNPLGYDITYNKVIYNGNKLEELRESKYIDLTIHHTNIKLKDLLSHIYILIPVFDKYKHYYMDDTEIDKIIKYGSNWLSNHPKKNMIVCRYLSKSNKLKDKALSLLKEYKIKEEDTIVEENSNNTINIEKKESLNKMRLNKVKDIILKNNVHSVLDLGCGEGNLISILLEESSIQKITGVDISSNALSKIKEHIYLYKYKKEEQDKLNIIVGSCLYKDDRFNDYDCICAIEMIEHLEPYKLKDFVKVVFKYAKPNLVIITTPNKDYNKLYEYLNEDQLRHKDHRFEFTREEFNNWCNNITNQYKNYKVTIEEVEKNKDEKLGSPTQLAIFKKI